MAAKTLTRGDVCRFCGAPLRLGAGRRIIGGYELVDHGCCGTVGVMKAPTSAELREVYNQMFASGEYEQHRTEVLHIQRGRRVGGRYREHLLRDIARLTVGRQLIELGVGSGAFGVMARSMGWRYRGYDISDIAVKYAGEAGLEVERFDATTLPPVPKATADLIVLWEVIEHLWDVSTYLKIIREGLRPGGTILLSTPNYLRSAYQTTDRWPSGMSPPVHLNFFTVASLQAVLARNGFRDPEVWVQRWQLPARLSVAGIASSLSLALGLHASPTIYARVRVP